MPISKVAIDVEAKTLVKKSKHLSKVLRYDPASAGITLTEAGWASVTAILQALNLKKEELDQVVAENNKSRFPENTDLAMELGLVSL